MNGEAKQLIPSINTIDFILNEKVSDNVKRFANFAINESLK